MPEQGRRARGFGDREAGAEARVVDAAGVQRVARATRGEQLWDRGVYAPAHRPDVRNGEDPLME